MTKEEFLENLSEILSMDDWADDEQLLVSVWNLCIKIESVEDDSRIGREAGELAERIWFHLGYGLPDK
jgi:hypothetical protein